MPFLPRRLLFWGLTDIINRNNNNNYYQSFNNGLRYFASNSTQKLSTPVSNKKKQKYIKHRQHVKKKPETKFEKIGIVECIGKNRKVNATLKESIADFQVHEIDQNGELVRLTYLGPPPKEDHILTRRGKFYTHCTLYKEGVTQAEVVETLVRHLRIDPGWIRWAGTTDKNAITCQRISVRDVSAWDLVKISEQSKTFKLGNFFYTSYPLMLGDAKGNHYEVVLRNVKVDKSDSPRAIRIFMESAVHSLREHGFVNYFSLQRFGTRHICNADIGKAALQQNWEMVIDLLLQCSSKSIPNEVQQAKLVWWKTHNPVEVIRNFSHVDRHPYLNPLDKEVFHALCRLGRQWAAGKRDEDLSVVLENVSKPVRDLFFSAFQAQIWNKLASFRLKTFGLQPIVGDTVDEGLENSFNSDDGQDVNSAWGPPKLKSLTQDDLKSDQYSIYNVLLTVPGNLIPPYTIPAVQEFYEKILKTYRLTPDCFAKFRPVTMTPVGFHRHLVVKPLNVNFRLISYTDDDAAGVVVEDKEDEISDPDKAQQRNKLILSDLDRINAAASRRENRDSSNQNRNNVRPRNLNRSNSNSSSKEQKVGAIVEFSIPRSTYATSALREIVNLPMGEPWMNTSRSRSRSRKFVLRSRK